MTRLWNGFSDMAIVKDDEFVVARGDGAVVWDEHGTEYIDAKGGLWYCAVGHGRAEIADAAREQMVTLAAYDTFGGTANRPALELAERVSAIAPMPNGAVFFGSGGSDAVDTAGKLARRYWHAVGRPGKTIIVHRDRSYHGMNAYGTSLAGIPANSEGFGPLVADIAGVPTDDTEALAEMFERDGDQIAAFIGEPVIGAGGVFHPVDGYWQRVRELCSKHDVLLIADEVICGFGRLGEWFGCQRVGIEPDLVTCAKGITSGYLPLGAVIASERVQEPFWTTPGTMFRHGYTYSGPPLRVRRGAGQPRHHRARAAAVSRVATWSRCWTRRSSRWRRFRSCQRVRAALGLLGAVEIDATARAAEPGLVDRLVKQCREQGVLTRGLAGHSLQVSPSFVIDEEQIDRIAEVFGAMLSGVAVETAV